jgi:phosphoesterase RecJ-like protein
MAETFAPTLTPKQAVVEKLRSAQRVLITTHDGPDGDALGSALALQHVLERLGKHVTVGMSGKINPNFDYLNGFSSIQSTVKSEPEFIIVLDETAAKTKNVEVRRLDATHLALVITPENAPIDASQLRFEAGSYPFDLIVVLDCPLIEMVGQFYHDHRELFEKVPMVNIDHHQNNAGFAAVSLADTNASATAEIMVSIIESLSQNLEPGTTLLDSHVANALLTGLLTDTGCFQNGNTTPKTLTVGAQLMAAGADHATIVQRVFKSKPISTLRLWGKALAHLREDKPLRFAWAVITRSDFVSAQANDDETSGLIDELIKSANDTDFVLLLTEKKDGLHGSFRSIVPGNDVLDLAKRFGGGGHKQAAAFMIPNGTAAEYEQRIINTLRQEQRGRLQEAAPSDNITP